jgi:hypothetical protein
MSRVNDSDSLAEKNYLAWLLLIVTVVTLSLILPFPISLLLSLIVIFSLSIIRANMVLKRAGMGGIKGWYKSYSSLQSGRGWGTGGDSFTYKPLTFYCMLCGNPHKKIACPKCGSKAVTAG